MFRSILEKFKDVSLNRLIIVFVLLMSFFCVTIVKLFKLQVLDDKKTLTIQKLTDDEEEKLYEIKQKTLPARGNIYDRNGKLLAYNELEYNLDFYNSAELKTNAERNAAILKLDELLNQYGLEKEFDFPMKLDENGNLIYTVSGDSLYRFLKNCFALISADDLTAAQRNITPDKLYQYLKKGNDYTSMFGISDDYTVEQALTIMCYRYQWYINNPSYASIRVVSGISDEFRIVMLENQNLVPCVEISKSYKRIYNDSIYFAHIIGYIGKIDETELAEFEDQGNTYYTAESKIGKLGVEKSFETYLQGVPGELKVMVNEDGRVVSKTVISDPVDGNDLYLSLDRDAQVAGYNLVEKNIASIVLNKMTSGLDYGSKGTKADDILIPVYEIYASLITNNVIDVSDFDKRELTPAEKNIYDSYLNYKSEIDDRIKDLISYGEGTKYNDCSDTTKEFIDFLYDSLRHRWEILTKNIDPDSEHFRLYADGELSLANFLFACVENGNVDASALNLPNGYYSSEEIYDALYNYILKKLETDSGYTKQIYRALIFNDQLSETNLCLVLYDQGVLKEDKESYEQLQNYVVSPYEFIRRKLSNLEITPAQIAQKPCSGSLVVTDPNNGSLLAMVSYPSYDNNRLTNSIDDDYYMKLIEDKSYPMLCRATQTRTNTGSTFKLLTSIAALTEGAIDLGTYITDEVVFKKIVPSPECHDNNGHGTIDVSGAIRDSCNYFFFETAYRFSLVDGVYSDEKGISVIRKYASLFGFDATTGVEISEFDPEISNTDAVRSAIGYFHNYAPIQIARYLTTVTNSGTCYDLTLIDSVRSKDGTVLYKKEPTVHHQLDMVDPAYWDAVHYGMRLVVEESVGSEFDDISVNVAGKTGTGQVSDNEPNNALFLSYAPYEDPEICVAVVLPNGYASVNAVHLAKEFYAYYYDGKNKDELLGGDIHAGDTSTNVVHD